MPERPISVTVLAIIDIVIGVLFVCCMTWTVVQLMGLLPIPNAEDPSINMMKENPAYAWFTYINTALTCVATLVLLCSGIGMLTLQPWSRIGAIIWSVYTIVSSILGWAINITLFIGPTMESIPEEQRGVMMIGFAVGILFTLAFITYAVLQVVLLTRPKVVRAFAGVDQAATFDPDSGGYQA